MNPCKQRRHGSRLIRGSLVVGLISGFVLTVSGNSWMPRYSVPWDMLRRETDGYRANANEAPGDELVLVYIGSSGCSWSNVPGLPAVVDGLKTTIQNRARRTGNAFATLGIARDAVAADGIAHLAKFGDFDEVISGRGWANTGVQKYIYGAMPGEGATPQVLVVPRISQELL